MNPFIIIVALLIASVLVVRLSRVKSITAYGYPVFLAILTILLLTHAPRVIYLPISLIELIIALLSVFSEK